MTDNFMFAYVCGCVTMVIASMFIRWMEDKWRR